jgi:hypothetical protein
MQEKISQGTPHDIKIFEGKPPPHSWVEQNIVKYFQVQSEMALLTDLVSYMHGLQQDKLLKGRTKPLQLKESFASIPEEGSAEDISNRAVYNSTQTSIKIHVESLEQMIHILQVGNPALAKELGTLLNQLKQMSANFPKLSDDQFQVLNSMMERLLEMAKQSSPGTKRAFWNAQLKMLQRLMQENGANIKAFMGETQEWEGQMGTRVTVQELMLKIQNALKKTPPTEKELVGLVEDLQTLANKSGLRDPELQKTLITFFLNLSEMKSTKGESLTHSLGEFIIQNKLKSFLQANPNASPKEIQNFMDKFLKESNLQSSNLPFMKMLGDAMEEIVNKEGFPESTASQGLPLVTDKNGQFSVNNDALSSLLATFAPNDKSLANLDQAVIALNAVLNQESSDHASKKAAYQNAIDHLSAIQNSLGKSALWAVAQALATGQPPPRLEKEGPKMGAEEGGPPGAAAPSQGGALPWDFANAILHHYMPNQQAFLRDLAMTFFINNMGADFGNTMLNNMIGFDGASNTFNFASFLQKSGNDFVGSKSQAQQRLSKEKQACLTAMNQIRTLLNKIGPEISRLEGELKNPVLSASQKSNLLGQIQSLKEIQTNLKVEYTPDSNSPSPAGTGYLVDAYKILRNIHVVDPVDSGHTSDKYYHITGNLPKDWQQTLSKKEGYVAQGDPKAKIPGGLEQIYHMANTYQTHYSDVNENETMILQLHLTDMSQQWTIVSTTLKELFQMFNQCAQAIYH